MSASCLTVLVDSAISYQNIYPKYKNTGMWFDDNKPFTVSVSGSVQWNGPGSDATIFNGLELVGLFSTFSGNYININSIGVGMPSESGSTALDPHIPRFTISRTDHFAGTSSRGFLFLAVYDSQYSDNSGSYSATICGGRVGCYTLGDILVHTDGTNDSTWSIDRTSNILFTVPSGGSINIIGSMYGDDFYDESRSSFFELYHNTTGITTGIPINGVTHPPSNPYLFTNAINGGSRLSNILVSSGDTIELRLIGSDALGHLVGVNFDIQYQNGPLYSLKNQWNETNPNGPWSYRTGNSPMTNYVLNWIDDEIPGWRLFDNPQPAFAPGPRTNIKHVPAFMKSTNCWGTSSSPNPVSTTNQCEYNPLFNNVDTIGDNYLLNQLEDNLKAFLDWGFLHIGGYINIHSPSSGLYGGEFSQLKPIDKPGLSPGRVWQTYKKDLIYESGIIFNNGLISNISGVTINSSFYPAPTGSGNVGYTINYPLGEITFNSPQNSSNKISLNYAHRWCQVYKSSTNPYWVELQQYTYQPNPQIDQKTKGEYNLSANHRIQTPCIIIEPIARSYSKPYQLGAHDFIIDQDVLLHIFTDNAFDKNKIADIIRLQKDKTIWLYDTNKVVKNNVYPLRYNGSINPSGLSYANLVNNPDYRWHKCYFREIDFFEMESRNKNLYWCTIRLTAQVII